MTTPTPEPRRANPPYTKKGRAAMGQALRTLRIEQDVTQTELAAAIGFRNQSNVSQIERGLKSITKTKLLRAARYLGVRPETLSAAGEAA